jgi:hypothetical protein
MESGRDKSEHFDSDWDHLQLPHFMGALDPLRKRGMKNFSKNALTVNGMKNQPVHITAETTFGRE